MVTGAYLVIKRFLERLSQLIIVDMRSKKQIKNSKSQSQFWIQERDLIYPTDIGINK